MKVSTALSLSALLACVACSGDTNPGSDASTDGGAGDGPASDGTLDGSGQDATPIPEGGMDAGPVVNPACTPPTSAPSGGSCVTLTGDGGIECNPVTNSPCTSTQACDFSQGGFHCYDPPPPNTANFCEACDITNGPACIGTATCLPTDGGTKCGRFCCDDGDCAPGHCDKTTFQSGAVGFCVN